MVCIIFTFHYVSINTECDGIIIDDSYDFTFHYVSINTKGVTAQVVGVVNTLHSTMFLLIQNVFILYIYIITLYIPLCFY